MGPARSPRALLPHAGLRALSRRSISASPDLPGSSSWRRPPLSSLPPTPPPFLARSWPGRPPPRAAAGQTRVPGKLLGRRGRSARGAGQVRGARRAPAANLGTLLELLLRPPRGSQDPSPSFLPRSSHTARTRSAFPPGCPRTPSVFAPGSFRSPLSPIRIPHHPLYISITFPGSSLQFHPSPDPSPASPP